MEPGLIGRSNPQPNVIKRVKIWEEKRYEETV